MGINRLINANQSLANVKVSLVLDNLRCHIVVIVPAVIAGGRKIMKMLHPQIQIQVIVGDQRADVDQFCRHLKELEPLVDLLLRVYGRFGKVPHDVLFGCAGLQEEDASQSDCFIFEPLI